MSKLYPETVLHKQVCKYIRYQYPYLLIHHSPNEGKRTVFQQSLIKSLGVSSGFPDLLLFNPKGNSDIKVVAIELKAGKNKATENQEKWIVALNNCGIPAKVCSGFDDAKIFIDLNF